MTQLVVLEGYQYYLCKEMK